MIELLDRDKAVLPENQRKLISRLIVVQGGRDFCIGNPEFSLDKLNKLVDEVSVHDLPPGIDECPEAP